MINLSFKSFRKQTINKFLLSKGFSSNNIFYLIKERNIMVDDNIISSKNDYVFLGSKVDVKLLDEVNDLMEYNKPLKILYEDDYLLIVNKDEGIEVEPNFDNPNISLASMVSYYFNKNNIKSKVHLVNRLDKPTSGIVIIAKNRYIHNLMNDYKIIKEYECLVEGITKKRGFIKVNIIKDDEKGIRKIDDSGKLSLTKYKRLKIIDNNSLLKVKLLTGRTHQIRVSMAYINHPLIGDNLYNCNYKKDTFMYLKAYHVRFRHPITHKVIDIKI